LDCGGELSGRTAAGSYAKWAPPHHSADHPSIWIPVENGDRAQFLAGKSQLDGETETGFLTQLASDKQSDQSKQHFGLESTE